MSVSHSQLTALREMSSEQREEIVRLCHDLSNIEMSGTRLFVDTTAPSEQAKSGAVGSCAYPMVFFDATPNGRVFAACVPESAIAVDASTRRQWRLACCAQPNGLLGSEANHIQSSFHNFISRMFPGIGLTQGFALRTLVSSSAMAGTSPKAAFDCCGPSTQLAVFIGEYKGNGKQGVRAGLTEAFAYARAAAIELFVKGVSWDQIVVPVFSTDGCSIQFGAVYHGAPKDGVLCMATSSVLDMTSEYGATWATAYFKKLEAHVQATQSLVSTARARQHWEAPPPGTIRIHKSLYLKEGGISFRALGNEADSLMHTMHVFEHLHASKAAPAICFPIGMYHGLRRAAEGKSSVFLAFPNLEEEGYSVYPPVDDAGVRLFISQLRLAVEKVHEAGIVHGDLYITNIMWNGNSVKIIDWDTAFFAEEGVPGALREQWEQNPKWKQYEQSEVIEDLDNFLVDTFEYAWTHGQWFSSAQSQSEMKQSFRESQLQLATQKGLIPQDE